MIEKRVPLLQKKRNVNIYWKTNNILRLICYSLQSKDLRALQSMQSLKHVIFLAGGKTNIQN